MRGRRTLAWLQEGLRAVRKEAVPLPRRDELTDGEYLVELIAGPDRLGRYEFVAYWLDETRPDGVAAQVFFTNLDQWVGQRLARGKSIRTQIRLHG